MSELIAQHLIVLKDWKDNEHFHIQSENIFDDISREFQRLQSSNPTGFRSDLQRVTEALVNNDINPNGLLSNFLLEYFIALLKIWSQPKEFSRHDDGILFEQLSIVLFENSVNINNDDVQQALVQCLYTIARIGKTMFTNLHITVITRLLGAYVDYASNNRYIFMNPNLLDDAVIKCFSTPYTVEIFSQYQSTLITDERTPSERFLFDGLLSFLNRMNRDQLGQYATELRQSCIPLIGDLLKAYLQNIDDCDESNLKIISQLTTTFLYSVQMTETNDIHLDRQIEICRTGVEILKKSSPEMRINVDCLQYLYMGTMHDKILDHLKEAHLTPTIFQFIQTYKEESEMQFNCYRILAALMNEDDIKRLEDPGAIAQVFLDQLDRVKDIEGWEVRIRNLLGTVKILLQHDQIRDEVYQRDGVPLLIYCATVERYDTAIKQRALENLLIMSFNPDVLQQLKENETLMIRLKVLATDSTQPNLQRSAESLIWVLTKDESSKEESGEGLDDVSGSAKSAYDIMISYSHKDKDLCFQLYDRLKQDGFRVWIDRDEMYGTPLESMSNAIEKSEFVLVCMSDSYKQSGYCKMEAYYALERQCSIIPLVMKAHYRPDGWLGIYVTGRMRIDFPKYGFADGYNKLRIEIDRTRKEKNKDKPLSGHDFPPLTSKNHKEPPITPEPSIKTVTKIIAKVNHVLPNHIELWTQEDVQQFFLQRDLECFLPICESMDGKRLLAMYQMCSENSPMMFQSLNSELKHKTRERDNQNLDLTHYLQFLEDMKSYQGSVRPQGEQVVRAAARSAACILM